ncbi:hypothetical protein DRN73_04355 [Candidatus Pacearchaeota archaeon]|nr:MAG: hypothetical protein DRN73_04355 [Candidatus Pacearchaeota archaeon]
MSKYKLIEAEKEKWNQIMSESPQFTVFNDIRYLDAVGRKYKNYFILKGDQIRAGVSIILTEDERGCEIDDLVIYNGIMFLPVPDKKAVRKRVEEFEITEFVIEKFDKQFSKIEMSLNPFFEDLRPFLWHNYHSSNPKDKFNLTLKYTSFINISEFFLRKPYEKMELFKNMDNKRQADVKNSIKKGSQVIILESKKASLFTDYYAQMMQEQGVEVKESFLVRLCSVIKNIIDKNIGIMTGIKNYKGQLSYITVFSYLLNESIYLFATGLRDKMTRHDATFCIWETFRILSEKGVWRVNMEGVNSPQRGWFKLSFGGNLKKYFQVRKDKT